jgi:protein phosphatase PTC2/3
MSSQEVVSFVRRKVYEGKELSEVCEMICDHCLAPDTSSGAGIGCDNMTILIVAVLHGRTKEEWYSWIHGRVENKHGYDTPAEPSQIYSLSRLSSFRARREAQAERERQRVEREESGSTGLGGLGRVLGSTGGISYSPGSGIRSDGGLMFGSDDSDDDSGDDAMDADDVESGRSFFKDSLGLGRPDSPDATKNLRAQLDEFERDGDGDAFMDDDSGDEIYTESTTILSFDASIPQSDVSPPHPQSPETTPPASQADRKTSETPPPPRELPNGDIKGPVEQLKPLPGGDEPSPAVKVEGFLDSSEDPLKGQV